MLRKVASKSVEQISDADLQAIIADYEKVHIDVGTGDAKFLLKKSKTEPNTLFIGLDAALDSLQVGAQKAARKPSRGGAPNVVLFQANVLTEDLPDLAGTATSLSVNFPWGDLLVACAVSDSSALKRFASWCKSKVPFDMFLNLHTFQTDHLREQFTLPEVSPEFVEETLKPAYAKSGWSVEQIEWLSSQDLKKHGSSWAGRLTKRSGRDTLYLGGTLNAS
jgi:16S rRNA (adenine(1408)-N(1))-methyltransferase